MTTALARNRYFAPAFLALAGAVYATAILLASHWSALTSREAVAVAMTLDMVVVVPLAFHFLIARPRGLPPVSVAPVLILSVVLAGLVVPREHRDTLHVLEAVVGLVEIGVVTWILRRTFRALRSARRDRAGDPLDQFREAARSLLHSDRAAGMFASEVGAFHYAFASWRSRPHTTPDAVAVTHHERSGQGGIVFGLLLVLLVEGIAVHFLLHSWSPVVAWLFTASTVYGGLWLLGDYRATVLRPILIRSDEVRIRAGLRWNVTIPRERIAEVVKSQPEAAKKETLGLVLMGGPSHWIVLNEPVRAEGPYGMSREVRVIGIEPDDPAAVEALRVT